MRYDAMMRKRDVSYEADPPDKAYSSPQGIHLHSIEWVSPHRRQHTRTAYTHCLSKKTDDTSQSHDHTRVFPFQKRALTENAAAP